jgi:hypothetical protein
LGFFRNWSQRKNENYGKTADNMNLLTKLKGGDLRSIGRADEVVKQIGNDQKIFDEVFHGIFDDDPITRMRSADVVEKVSQKYPLLLKKHKTNILNHLENFKQQEVKWHISLMISRLKFTKTESEKVFAVLSNWIVSDRSKIVRVNAMQALADISFKNINLKKKTITLIRNQIGSRIPSLTSRGVKLLNQLTPR